MERNVTPHCFTTPVFKEKHLGVIVQCFSLQNLFFYSYASDLCFTD